MLGYAYAARFHPRAAYRWSAEASIYLAPEARGRGIGSSSSRAARAAEGDGLRERVRRDSLPNPASERLLESFGFKKIAHWEHVGFKFDAWHDVSWRQLTLQEPTVPPPELRASPGER